MEISTSPAAFPKALDQKGTRLARLIFLRENGAKKPRAPSVNSEPSDGIWVLGNRVGSPAETEISAESAGGVAEISTNSNVEAWHHAKIAAKVENLAVILARAADCDAS